MERNRGYASLDELLDDSVSLPDMIAIFKVVRGIPISLGVASTGGKNDPGKNKVFAK